MLDHFVVDLPEAEPLVLVGVIVQRDAVKAAASRITWRRSPVESHGALRMEIRGFGRQGQAGWRVCTRSRPMETAPHRAAATTWTAPASAQHQQAPCRPERQGGRPVRLREIEVRAIVFRRAHPDAIERRLVSPRASHRGAYNEPRRRNRRGAVNSASMRL